MRVVLEEVFRLRSIKGCLLLGCRIRDSERRFWGSLCLRRRSTSVAHMRMLSPAPLNTWEEALVLAQFIHCPSIPPHFLLVIIDV